MPNSHSPITTALEAACGSLDSWKREHAQVCRAVYPLEDLYRIAVRLFEAVLERDTRMNLRACDDPAISLDAETDRTKADLRLIDVLCAGLEEQWRTHGLAGYEGVDIDLDRVQDIRARIRDYLDPEPTYLRRPDVEEALRGAEAEHDRGAWHREPA